MFNRRLVTILLIGALSAIPLAAHAADAGCVRTITAKVVALDQPYFLNRLGASMPEGMIFALERDVVPTSGGFPLKHGKVRLRDGKRPRPLVLRANVGDCVAITFRNLLSDIPAQNELPRVVQPATRYASVHIAGMMVVSTIMDDGSYAGTNSNGTIPPSDTASITYTVKATEEGTFLLNSMGAAFGGFNQPNDGAQVSAGMFGAMNVQPAQAEWFRSQVTHDDLEFAIDHTRGTNGFSPAGQPFLNYDAVYPPGNANAGKFVLRMLDHNEIIYSDLTAVITGPNGGQFVNSPPPGNPSLNPINIEPNRLDPYREFTIEYHELNDMVQAFPIFNSTTSGGTIPPPPQGGSWNINSKLNLTLVPSGDAFAINYGTGGIGAEILANRFGLGPMGSCVDCRFEEFFLSAWPVGDAAMLVDYPANTPCSDSSLNKADATAAKNPLTGKTNQKATCTPGVKGNAPTGVKPVRKATKAFFPDDPSNVYHSYINDRVKFRILHAGTGVAHVHHLHAHQWVHSPNSDGSAYLDSQLINPGSAYTLEISFNGGGNRNKVVGDSIFHCHFYPHFAAGMWAMWRTHDVFEVGSPFTGGSPELAKYQKRALPDGEIAAGTPIPALVPMPVLAMPPMPGEVSIVAVPDPNNTAGPPVGWRTEMAAGETQNPGFPFFIPGVAGSRAPHPPLDFAKENNKELDGGLPRHIILNGKITNEKHTTLDFSKDYDHVNAYQLPEDGTPEELVAMKYHSTCFHDSFTPAGAPAGFRTNGLPQVSGAPFADPGLVPYDPNNPPVGDAQCKPIANWINYKAAVIQTDVVLNKKGWHYPQSRFLTLWADVLPTFNNDKPAEPFFIRANAGQGVVYWHTNLVPDYFQLDDFEVKTPTDIIGQHIHLVKFDVTSSDGAANGWNYEDGTLAPDEVRHQISAITQCGGLAIDLASIKKCGTGTRTPLSATNPPTGICPGGAGTEPCKDWIGAQTTVQRWLADPIPFDNKNGTRTLRTVFTHDHFGPSTHQQTGLYAALLVEPTDSKWSQSEDGTPLHTRDDGGPTTWNAIIETPGDAKNTYREFAMGMADFQLAYYNTSISKKDAVFGWADPPNAIEPQTAFNTTTKKYTLAPQIISAGPTQGTTSFNYRNEPLPYRVAPSTGNTPATDLAYVFSSNITRNDPAMNSQPTPGSPINPANPTGFMFPKKELTQGMQGGDPYTPLLRAYEGDRVQIRLIAGAHMLPHAFTVGGMKWLFEPSFDSSGYRSTQEMGISEHFEMIFDTPRASPSSDQSHQWADYLYQPDASNQTHGIVDGTWGIFRAYQAKLNNLMPLPTNQDVKPLPPPTLASGYSCPPDAPVKAFTINSFTPNAALVMNSRGSGPAGRFNTPITNSAPMMYLSSTNQQATEPLILHANANDCIALTVQNGFNASRSVFSVTSTAKFANGPTSGVPFPQPIITMGPSKYTGLTPALLSFDAMASTGLNVGFNPDQVSPIGGQKTYYWYAGQTTVDNSGPTPVIKGEPIELGSVNLTPADPLEQDLHGLIAGMVVEPTGSIFCPDTWDPSHNVLTFASGTVYRNGTCTSPADLLFREFSLVTQDDLTNVAWQGGSWTLGQTTFTSPAGNTSVAVNYRTEPMSYRFADASANFYKRTDIFTGFSDSLVLTDPQTPVFTAAQGTPTRFRLLHPAGSGNQQVMALHGHVWQELPYIGPPTSPSNAIGDNTLSQHLGARDNYGTNSSYEIVIPSAGGDAQIGGDYLWRTTPANYLELGLWGLFRVCPSGADSVKVTSAQFTSGSLSIYGSTSPFVDTAARPENGKRAATVALALIAPNGTSTSLGDVSVGANGLWNKQTNTTAITGNGWTVSATSPSGGKGSAPVLLTVIPATPNTSAGTPKTGQAESRRFVDPPRQHSNEPPPQPPTLALPAPPKPQP